MSDTDLLIVNASLRALAIELRGKLGDAEQALFALSRGEVDAVALASSVTPLLLRQAQAEARSESAERLRISQQLRALADASREFSSTTDDYRLLLDAIARRLSSATDGACVVSLLSGDGLALDAVAIHSPDEAVARAIRAVATRYLLADHVEVRETLAGRPLMDPPLAGETVRPPGRAASYAVTGQHCRLWVALRLRGEPLGILALLRSGPGARPFDVADRDLAQALADHAALAIGNARSYEAERAARAAAERAAGALRDAESRFRRLSESGLIGILVGDNRGQVEEANDAVLRMLGYARDELIGGAVVWKELTPPEWRAGDVRAVAQLATSGVAELREKEYFRKDGVRVPVLVGSAQLEGEASRSISFVLDLTERKAAQAAQELHREERAAADKFRGLVESAPDAMIVVRRDGAVALVNGQFERLFGYGRDEILGTSMEALVPDHARGAHASLREGYFRNPRVRQMGELLELRARRRDGTEFPIEVSLSPVETGEGLLVASTIRDITERKRAEEQRARLAAIVDSSDDAIIGKTPDGTVTSWNRGAEVMFGYAAEAILGKSITLLVPDDRAQEERGIREAAARGEVQRLDSVRRTQDGRLIDVALSISPVRDAKGHVAGLSNVMHDVTERKRDEVALRHARDAALSASRELETFSYSVAHDLRSPLRAMSGFAELLVEVYTDKLDAEGQSWLHEVQGGSKRMSTLIEALLSLSRVARDEMRRQDVDLTSLARTIGARLAASAPRRSFELVIEEGLRADMDARLAGALFENLLGNAFKFTSKRATACVEVGATLHEGVRTFFVRDNGAGFDMAYADKLFGPFQRLHAAADFPGTGIGLATVQRIVHRHGGRIWAEGTVDGGATFFFTLSSRPDAGQTT